MGLAREQELPGEKKEPSQWSFRRLLGGSPVRDSITKTFSNPFEWLLGYMILIIGAAELFGHAVSWIFYGLTLVVFTAAVYIHLQPPPIPLPKKEVKKEKSK